MKTFPLLLIVSLCFSGCATSMLSEKIRRDHRYIHYVYQDPDRVHDVLAAARDGDGNVFILYRGAHGTEYKTDTFLIRVPARRIARARKQAEHFPPHPAGFLSAALPLPRRMTRPADGLPPDATLPVRHFRYDSSLSSYPEFLRKAGAEPAVIQRDRTTSLHGFVLTRKVSEPSLDLALYFPLDGPGEPGIHLNLCTPWKTKHDFSGTYWRMLYPATVAWDVVTFPVQAAAAVIFVAIMPQGGWMF